MLFKGHVRYDNVKILMRFFGKMFTNHGALIYQRKQKNRMIYLIILKYQLKKGTTTMSNINNFHGRFSVLSAIRSPFKLKIYNCSHHHHLESTVQKGPMIEVIIPDFFSQCFIVIMFTMEHYRGSSVKVDVF